MCKYELAAKAHKNIYKIDITPNKIKKEVEEMIKDGKGLLTESAAFVNWLDELHLREEYKKLHNEMKKEKSEKNDIVDFVKRGLGAPDIIEIFGETRSLKTFTAYRFAVEASKKGGKVLYIDTERNMDQCQIEELKSAGCDYTCIINFRKLLKYISSIPKGYTHIVLDSIGLPALGEFAILSTIHGKGQVLLNIQAILYLLKDYSLENNCYVLVTNQPASEMNRDEYFTYRGRKMVDLPPFGDKGSFFVKEIYRAIPVIRGTLETVVDLVAWGSRVHPKYTPVIRLIRRGTKLEVKTL